MRARQRPLALPELAVPESVEGSKGRRRWSLSLSKGSETRISTSSMNAFRQACFDKRDRAYPFSAMNASYNARGCAIDSSISVTANRTSTVRSSPTRKSSPNSER